MSLQVGRRGKPMFSKAAWVAFAVCALMFLPTSGEAQQSQANVELTFTPTSRAQIAVWVERDDGQFMGTFALTHAVAVAGIGNRPGALQMNSGYRWPYGRREGVLPVWAHRRAQAPGAKKFKRVIFQNRTSEGRASLTSSDSSPDNYYCLSFERESAGRDALDAVTCASVFSSDKGRFITDGDVKAGYGEPHEDPPGQGKMRKLSIDSLYPPRRDVTRCSTPGCLDHPDVAQFAKHAVDVMPELDAISRATLQGERRASWTFAIPEDWSNEHEYVLYVEVNVEGDYNGTWNDRRFPTPLTPADQWDDWAMTYGYPYRGQPSVVYALPFTLNERKTTTASKPAGYGSLEGQDGMLRPIDGTISDDPSGAKGSGADRLLSINGVRASISVNPFDPCSGDNPAPMCGMACDSSKDSCGTLYCDRETKTCKPYCAATSAPEGVRELKLSRHPEKLYAHMWARMSFRAPASERPISSYDVFVRPEGGEWIRAFTPDRREELLPVALDVCDDPKSDENRCMKMQAGTVIEADLTNLLQSTRYEVSVTPRDAECNEAGPVVIANFETPQREFTTVSPCFVATATYGSPMAAQVSVLRRVRDRYLASNAPGRAFIAAYYEYGPKLSAFVREHDWARSLSRALLSPVVALSAWWVGE